MTFMDSIKFIISNWPTSFIHLYKPRLNWERLDLKWTVFSFKQNDATIALFSFINNHLKLSFQGSLVSVCFMDFSETQSKICWNIFRVTQKVNTNYSLTKMFLSWLHSSLFPINTRNKCAQYLFYNELSLQPRAG